MTVDRHGRIVVADKGNQRIQLFSPNGEWLAIVGNKEEGGADKMVEPRSPAIGRDGQLIVPDYAAHSILIFD